MIIGQHPDGRIALLAREHGIPHAVYSPENNQWSEKIVLTGEELSSFIRITEKKQQQSLLQQAINKLRNKQV